MAQIAVVSGYKPFELGVFKQDEPALTYIKKAIKKELIILLEEGLEWVIISGQLGVELWAAEVVLELQIEGYEHLQLGVITPFLHQEENWKDNNKELYESIIAQADFVDSVSRKPYESPNQFRMKNQFLVAKSDTLLMLYDTEKEGTPKYLYEVAKKHMENHDYNIRQITFYDLQMIVEEEQMRENGF
ncbi:putative phage-like protein YoqJ [Cytobacillus horneckiae]|uniref:DUF1273 domain-containing protein n=1 Tax=Cytobacillus horneckiae TaxID=549687 RepID=UPI0019D0D082|nr:DUF1273 domain-containing protein [Cytobacillus horneckiae]MBN6888472.1 DUF1273 domain-containing protein [Cytobacillus horneckiae]